MREGAGEGIPARNYRANKKTGNFRTQQRPQPSESSMVAAVSH